MFTERWADRYLANPANPAAVRLVKLRGNWQNRPFVVYLSNGLGVVGILGSLWVLAYWWTLPASWYGYYYGENGWIGMILFIVCLAVTVGIWKGIRIADEWDQAEVVCQLVRKGEVVNVPVEIYGDFDRKLRDAKLQTFARTSYVVTPEDFEIIRQASKAAREGHLDERFRRDHIDPLLNQIIIRIRTSYDLAHQAHEAKLAMLRSEHPEG